MALLVFLLAPIVVLLVEIGVFIKVGATIGALPVLALTVLTALVGLALVRAQGLETLRRAHAEIDAGVPPVRELIEGAMLVIAGLCLLVPGFVTDLCGAILLVPPLRARLADAVVRRTAVDAPTVIVDAEYWQDDVPPPLRGPDDDLHS